MNYFEGCSSEAERKTRFRELAKKHHPDVGGDPKVMAEINAQYSGNGGSTQARSKNWSFDFGDAAAYAYDYFRGQSQRSRTHDAWFEEQLRAAQMRAEEEMRRQKSMWEEQIRAANERKAKIKETLISCPFCGSKNLSPGFSAIECQECGACGPEAENEEEAAAAWNTRGKIMRATTRR